jgi:hypothetical protein
MPAEKRPVVCRECSQPVLRRADLDIVGQALVPLHARCREKYATNQPQFLRSLPINRLSSWVAFNALIVAGIVVLILVARILVVRAPPVPLEGLIYLFALFNGGMLVSRGIAWYSIERHLPY